MELSQSIDKYIHLPMSAWLFGALFLYGVIMYLLLNSSVIHRPPLSIKEKSRSIKLSMRTAGEGSTVSSSRHPFKACTSSHKIQHVPESGRCP